MPIFYFRNDDVNVLDDALVNVTRRCTDQGVPITHTVEPANVTDDCLAWLREVKERNPGLIELMQHGYDHRKRDVGEFGGRRPYEDQLFDLRRGRDILQRKLGPDFLPAINYPFGPYNQHTIRATDELGFRILCSHYNCRLSRRLMYAAGRALRRGQIRGRHISYHLGYYPRSRLFCIDMATTFIRRYFGEYGSRDCEFFSPEEILARVTKFVPHTPVIGVLLHHRFHDSPASLDAISTVIAQLKKMPDAEFLNLETIYRRYSPDPELSFRQQ